MEVPYYDIHEIHFKLLGFIINESFLRHSLFINIIIKLMTGTKYK